MNILKLLGVVVGVHLVAYLVIVQPGCRSTTAKPAPVAATTAPAASAETPALPVASTPEPLAAVAFNLPFAQSGAPTGDRYAPTRPGTEEAAASTPAKTYTVQKGDSFYTIARRHGLTVTELTAANNLSSGTSLRPGQKLVIPAKSGAASGSDATAPAARSSSGATASVASGATYTVKSGDTLSKIASRYRTTSAALRSLNGIAGDHLRIGQILQIPGNGSTAAAPAANLPPPPAATPITSPGSGASLAPTAAGVHTVSAGESAEAIARRYGITVNDLARANPGQLSDPRKIRVGQVLTIPGAGAARAARPAPSLVPETIAPAPSQPVEAPAPVPTDGAVEGDAPVIPIDEAPPAVPVPQID